MTLKQFRAAFAIAKDFSVDLSDVDNSNHFGFGLSTFKPVYTTLNAVAKTIRWQALCFNGQWDATLLDEVSRFGRKNFLILD